jgi:hypothetical protein
MIKIISINKDFNESDFYFWCLFSFGIGLSIMKLITYIFYGV